MTQRQINRRNNRTRRIEHPEQEPLLPPEPENIVELETKKIIVTANTTQTEEENWDNFFNEAEEKEVISDSPQQARERIDEAEQKEGE